MNVWEKVDEDTLKLLNDQKAFEDETVKKLNPLYKATENPLVRLFVHQIILDSMRHSDTYQALIDLNRRALLGETERKRMTEELADHIMNESRMMDKAVEITKFVKDTNFKRILERVVEDERRHHKILQELFEIVKKEAKDWNRYLYDMFTGAGIP